MMKTPHPFATVLRKAGFRATPRRIGLLEAFAEAKKPLSAEGVFLRLGRRAPDPATIYRALGELTKAGILREVNLRRGHAHYELRDTGDHHHLICTSCGRVEDFEGCGIESLAQAALRGSPGFAKVQDHALELFGTCKKCAARPGFTK